MNASEKGLPAFNRILGNLPPVLDAFQPFLRNVNPIVDHVSKSKKEVAGLLANATGATEAAPAEDECGGMRAAPVLTGVLADAAGAEPADHLGVGVVEEL